MRGASVRCAVRLVRRRRDACRARRREGRRRRHRRSGRGGGEALRDYRPRHLRLRPGDLVRAGLRDEGRHSRGRYDAPDASAQAGLGQDRVQPRQLGRLEGRQGRRRVVPSVHRRPCSFLPDSARPEGRGALRGEGRSHGPQRQGKLHVQD